jgi:hypothetical protein
LPVAKLDRGFDYHRPGKPAIAAVGKILLDLVRELEGQTGPTSPETASFTEADEKVIARYTGLTGSSDAERIGAVVPGPHCR